MALGISQQSLRKPARERHTDSRSKRIMKNETTIGGITIGGQPSADELGAGRFATVVNIRRDDEAGNVTGELLEGDERSLRARSVHERHGHRGRHQGDRRGRRRVGRTRSRPLSRRGAGCGRSRHGALRA
jgi:hypothetical protein